MTDRQEPLTPDRYPPLEVGPYMLTNYGPPQEAPCAYCGSVNGETPPSAYALDPLTGDTIRVAIDAACDLSNPRLSEVDWDAVGGALGLRVCNKPEDHFPARQEAADTSGLRAALEARIAHWRDVVKVQPMARTTLKAVLATIDAVLSQGPTPDERPLDVDALARLLHEYEKVKGHPGCGWKFDSTMPDGTPLCPCRGYAARLSAAGE